MFPVSIKKAYAPVGVAPLAVAQAPESHRGTLERELEILEFEAQDGRGGNLHPTFVRHDGVDDRILGGGFVEVDGDVDILALEQLLDRMRHALGIRPIGPAREATVQIAGFDARELLPGGIVEIDQRIGPLVNRVHSAGAVPERPLSFSKGDRVLLRICLHGIRAGVSSPGGLRDNDDTALSDGGMLNDDDAGEKPRRLVRVDAAKHNKGPARLLPLKDVDRRLAAGTQEVGE